jgi:hypothetical protein
MKQKRGAYADTDVFFFKLVALPAEIDNRVASYIITWPDVCVFFADRECKQALGVSVEPFEGVETTSSLFCARVNVPGN